MVVSGSCERWEVGNIFHPPNEGKDYKWYISGFFKSANWGMKYATDPIF